MFNTSNCFQNIFSSLMRSTITKTCWLNLWLDQAIIITTPMDTILENFQRLIIITSDKLLSFK